MGGNAFKNIKTERLQKAEYDLLSAEVCRKMADRFRQFTVITAYKNKKDFGDLDLLITKPKPDGTELNNFLADNFNSREIVHNGDFVSFEYNNFQVDLIFIEPEYFDTACFYYSYNDINNLCGKIGHKFGVKFGFKGLWYPLRNGHGGKSEEVLLSTDVRKIYDFTGFDYDRYLKGFDNLEDIFEFVINSSYFNSEIFTAEKSQVAKVRERKRKTYHGFLNYLEGKSFKQNFQFDPDKEKYIEMIKDYFPEANLKQAITEFNRKVDLSAKINEKFNGKLVMEYIPGIEGKNLGNFIIQFKTKYNDFDNYILNSPAEVIRQDILDFYTAFQAQ